MRTAREWSLNCVASGVLMALFAITPAAAQPDEASATNNFAAETAADAAFGFAQALDSTGPIVSDDTYLSALESDAEAGRPLAMWQLGEMYETGQGVDKDPVKAFGYYSQIAIQHADTAPKGLEADIVARSFVKLGDYFREGAPEVGIHQDPAEYHRMLLHAATYFGDAEAQYRVGVLYQQADGLGISPTLSARWLQYAANKGHCLAQARLGELLFNGMEDYAARPAEGLMWLNVAQATCLGTPDQNAADRLLETAMRKATPDLREAAISMARTGTFAQVSGH